MDNTDLVQRIDATAGTQHGLVTSSQASTILGPRRKDYWLRTSRLLRVQPRVLRVAGSPATWHQALMAAQLAAGGIVSHRSAGELWGLTRQAGFVEVSIRPNRKVRLCPPAATHRIRDLHEHLAVERDGLSLTDPIRTLVDLGLVLPTWAVDAALKRALTSKLVTWSEVQWLRDALGRRGRNGTGVIGDLLERRRLTVATEESPLESALVDLLSSSDLPSPEYQYEVWDRGRFVARVDAAYAEKKVAIEVDGYAAHGDPDAFQRDRRRQNILVALGWTVLRFTWHDVVREPQRVLTIIRRTICGN